PACISLVPSGATMSAADVNGTASSAIACSLKYPLASAMKIAASETLPTCPNFTVTGVGAAVVLGPAEVAAAGLGPPPPPPHAAIASVAATTVPSRFIAHLLAPPLLGDAKSHARPVVPRGPRSIRRGTGGSALAQTRRLGAD